MNRSFYISGFILLLSPTLVLFPISCGSNPTTPGAHTPTPVSTDTPTTTSVNTATKTPTNTSTNTPTNTSLNTATNSPTPSPSSTATNSPTLTPTPTISNTTTNTATLTVSSTATPCPTDTPTFTTTNTPTVTETSTSSSTATDTTTATQTSTPTNTPTPAPTNAGVVTTLAGSAGVTGSTNATGTAALFNLPLGIGVDSSGNVYVADTNNNLIRLITPGGVVTTFAGSGSPGFTNATGTAASFDYPAAIAVDSSGNVYVAEPSYNQLIRKISSGATVTTLAGTVTAFGSSNGTGTAASFWNPYGIAVDSSGNVYVADTSNHLIREISPGGVVTTLAGSTGVPGSSNGTGTLATFNGPWGLAVDTSGNVYVGDAGNHLIRKIAPGGVVTTLAGSGTYGFANGTGTAASFGLIRGIAVDASGNVYVADEGTQMIREISPGGVVTTLAGSANVFGSTDATGTAALFNYPFGIAVDSNGIVYVSEKGNMDIRKIQ